ncbi:MAG: VWA domain-containing protein [Gammaproteobacteria bacterium]|nr:VWA domain-containing protein [Gammaproteobacteria bacterium]
MHSLLNHVVRFTHTLHDAGIKVSSSEVIDLCRALRLVDIGNRREFHAASVATLIRTHEDRPRFDDLFSRYWDQVSVPGADPDRRADDAGREAEPPPAGSDPAKQRGVSSDSSAKQESPAPAEREPLQYSAQETLMHKDIGAMTPEELEAARAVVGELVHVLASYRSRRYRSEGAGPQLDFRRIFRRSAPYGEYATRLAWRRRREKKTRLVLLCDVSGSMQAYSLFLIQFIYALRQELPQVDVGVFSTRLTMITDLLSGRDLASSLREVAERVKDWGSGTDIGGCVREFNDRHAREVLRARTLIVILSDGWDRGDARLMQSQIELLTRRVHKLIWLNPLLGDRGYLPLCRGIRTALPYMDYFLPAHNLDSLRQLSRTLRRELH